MAEDKDSTQDEPPQVESYEQLSNPEITQHYLSVRREFRELQKRVERISLGSGGISSTGNRMFWSSVLFTRLSVNAKSINHLLPDPRPGEHWDFGTIASLVRNLIETTLVYHWLCGSNITEEVRQGRFILLYLNDYGSRRRLFPEQFTDPDPIHEDLVRRFDANPYLATYNAKKRRDALKGEKTPFIQDDVLSEIGVDPKNFRMLYRFFSQHTHTGPIAYFRIPDHGRGTGVETRIEKIYMLIAVEAASNSLLQAINEHLAIFPEAETRPPFLTRRQIENNVEIEQGRRRQKRNR